LALRCERSRQLHRSIRVRPIFHCAVRVEQVVTAGEAVGEMVDLLGEPLERIIAPVGGVVLFLVTSPAIKKDGLLLAIGAL
jgi:predicted deacylase